MLYINDLHHLTSKSADLESIYVIREIKQKVSYPLTGEKINEHFSPLFLSDIDLEYIKQASQLVEPTIGLIKKILLEKNPIHEPVNLQRSIQLLKEVSLPLNRQFDYVQGIKSWQSDFSEEAAPLLNNIPKLKTEKEKTILNQQLNKLFQTILRNDKFLFNAADIIDESSLTRITNLSESLERGFLFHVTLEEEIKKQNFVILKAHLPPDKVEEAETIQKKVDLIKKGVERSYEINLCMVNWVVLLYSYVKWLLSSSFGGK